jgi:hypothetical protein
MTHNSITSEVDLLKVIRSNRPLSDRHLGELLLEKGKLSHEQLQEALAWQERHPGIHLGDILVDKGFCSREQVTVMLAAKLGIPYVRLGEYEIPPHVLRLVPADIAIQHNVLPLACRDNHLIIAMENPLDSKCSTSTTCNTVTRQWRILPTISKYWRWMKRPPRIYRLFSPSPRRRRRSPSSAWLMQ